MGTFEQLQRKSSISSTRAASTSSSLRTSRPFAPPAISPHEQVSTDQQTPSQYGAGVKHSLAHIPIFRAERENHTGMPNNLKTGIENLSGISMHDVRVHYNSPKPAQVEALAYTQGVNIHIGAGQEKYLPHEAWHAVQQKQRRVKPTLRLGDMAINGDQELEREAEVMGAKAAQGSAPVGNPRSVSSVSPPSSSPIQGVFTYKGKVLDESAEEIQAVLARLGGAKYAKLRKAFEQILSGEKEEALASWVSSYFLGESVKSIVAQWKETLGPGKVSKRKVGKSRKASREVEAEEGELEEEEAPKKRKAGKSKKRSREVEAEESEPEEEEAPKKGKKQEKLNELATEIHEDAGGDPSQSTTGVGRLQDGSLVVATQLALGTVQKAATNYDIPTADVKKTKGAGYHTEVSLFIDYGKELVAVGASQGFCPDCQEFLRAKGIKMEGSMRKTPDQVWYCPEFYNGVEKNPVDARYPYALEKDAAVSNSQVEYKTKKEYDYVHKKQKEESGKVIRTPAIQFLEEYRKTKKK